MSVCACITHVLSPNIRNQSIHPPSLRISTRTDLPSENYLIGLQLWHLIQFLPFQSILKRAQQHSIRTTWTSSTIMAAQQSHTTEPTVSHGRGGVCKSWAFSLSALTQFEQVREMCSQIAPRRSLPSENLSPLCAPAYISFEPCAPLAPQNPYSPPPGSILPWYHTEKLGSLLATRMAK